MCNFTAITLGLRFQDAYLWIYKRKQKRAVDDVRTFRPRKLHDLQITVVQTMSIATIKVSKDSSRIRFLPNQIRQPYGACEKGPSLPETKYRYRDSLKRPDNYRSLLRLG